jgi:FAD/FMN-containing dehydrogenase
VSAAQAFPSWGRAHKVRQRHVHPGSVAEIGRLLAATAGPFLPYGLGRSYGDVCLNHEGTMIDTRRLDHFREFDERAGTIICEAGVSLAQLIGLLVQRPRPDGSYWFPAVVPGTQFVTVGGAIANDVHGKNHEIEGTFGRHVEWIDLVRSDGQTYRCSANEQPELFAATIGGLGLTGVIASACLRLKSIPGLMMEAEHHVFDQLDDHHALSEEGGDWTHRAAWIDVLATGKRLGRGIYSRSRFVAGSHQHHLASKLSVPFEAPAWLLGPASIKLFNAAYRRKHFGRRAKREVVPFTPLLFPLDAIRDWNRLYGRDGFCQFQCALPRTFAKDALRDLLETIARSGQGSALTVLKEFGDLPSPGLLSFPIPGTTLAVDFQNRGKSTLALLERLDSITDAAGGRVYAAKDGRASAALLRAGFPQRARFERSIDPKFTSDFWRRTVG